MKLASSQDQRYFPVLTGVRAIAAYMVYVRHFNPIPEEGAFGFLHDILYEFHIGVTIFFVLSGFLICFRYMDSIAPSPRWIFTYIRNRIARIYPMYFLLTIATFLVVFIGYGYVLHMHTLREFVLNITFLRGFFDELKFTGVAQGWSLTVEETFYFLAPVIILLGRRHHIFFQTIFWYMVGLLLVKIGSSLSYYGFFSTYRFMFSYTFFGRCFEFYVGVYLAFVYKGIKKAPFLETLKYKTYIGIAIILLVAIVLASLKSTTNDGIMSPIGIGLNNIVLPVGIALFFYGLLLENSGIKKLLSTRLFELLGKSSYTFYLIHMGIIQHLLAAYISTNSLVVFILLNIVSIVLFLFVEEPLNNLIRKIKLPAKKVSSVLSE